jgi:hypothetical protein
MAKERIQHTLMIGVDAAMPRSYERFKEKLGNIGGTTRLRLFAEYVNPTCWVHTLNLALVARQLYCIPLCCQIRAMKCMPTTPVRGHVHPCAAKFHASGFCQGRASDFFPTFPYLGARNQDVHE